MEGESRFRTWWFHSASTDTIVAISWAPDRDFGGGSAECNNNGRPFQRPWVQHRLGSSVPVIYARKFAGPRHIQPASLVQTMHPPEHAQVFWGLHWEAVSIVVVLFCVVGLGLWFAHCFMEWPGLHQHKDCSNQKRWTRRTRPPKHAIATTKTCSCGLHICCYCWRFEEGEAGQTSRQTEFVQRAKGLAFQWVAQYAEIPFSQNMVIFRNQGVFSLPLEWHRGILGWLTVEWSTISV